MSSPLPGLDPHVLLVFLPQVSAAATTGVRAGAVSLSLRHLVLFVAFAFVAGRPPVRRLMSRAGRPPDREVALAAGPAR